MIRKKILVKAIFERALFKSNKRDQILHTILQQKKYT
jgi:hypothetical protein